MTLSRASCRARSPRQARRRWSSSKLRSAELSLNGDVFVEVSLFECLCGGSCGEDKLPSTAIDLDEGGRLGAVVAEERARCGGEGEEVLIFMRKTRYL